MLKIDAIGESTFCGYYAGSDHKEDIDACVPLMLDKYLTSVTPGKVVNKATDSALVDYHINHYGESYANIAIINLGINDAVFGSVTDFVIESFAFDSFKALRNWVTDIFSISKVLLPALKAKKYSPLLFSCLFLSGFFSTRIL